MNQNKKTLPIILDKFGFAEREKINGKAVQNKCGRDFLYYVLNYYRPAMHNANIGNPLDIENKRLFGLKIPPMLSFSFLQFFRVPSYFNSLNLSLNINGKSVKIFSQFIYAALFSRTPACSEAINIVERAVDDKIASGIDISVALGGLIDHVMFVYGYDEKNFYVFDTHQAKEIEYEKITPLGDRRFIMRLPKDVICKRWSRWNRVWIIEDVKGNQ